MDKGNKGREKGKREKEKTNEEKRERICERDSALFLGLQLQLVTQQAYVFLFIAHNH
jgi:hypothetical protein